MRDAMQEYSEFAPYDAGIILPGQVAEDNLASGIFVETRSHDECTEATVPGTKNIKWLDIFGRLDEISTDPRSFSFLAPARFRGRRRSVYLYLYLVLKTFWCCGRSFMVGWRTQHIARSRLPAF